MSGGFASPVIFLERAINIYGNCLAIVCGNKRYTYREYYRAVSVMANVLVKLGVQRGDRVAYLGFNCHRLLEAYFGILWVGAIINPINVRLSPVEIEYILNHSGARFLIFDTEFVSLIKELQPNLRSVEAYIMTDPFSKASVELPSGAISYEKISTDVKDEAERVEVCDDDVAALFYTSGTSAHPRGVMLTHRNIYANALNLIASLGLNDSDVVLHTIPLFHANGWGTPHAMTAVGGAQVVIRKFDPKEVCTLIETEGVTWACMVPTMVNMLLNYPDLQAHCFRSLSKLVVGGASSPESFVPEVESKLGCTYIASYGLTEASPVVLLSTMKHSLRSEPREQRQRRQAKGGLPVVGVEVKVIDDHGKEVEHDGLSMGEILVRGDTVMKGYWNDPEETSKTIRNGWLYTGDIGTVDSEGYIDIVDRKKDIIISGGENISSLEVENVIYSHPAVLEAAVIGVPDAKWGEVPKAYVVVKPGKCLSQEELISFCRERLAKFKVPKFVEFVEALPKTGTGKVQKRILKKMS